MTSFWHRKSEPMWSKIASWTTLVGTPATFWVPSSFSLMHKNKHFQPHSGQRAVLMCPNALHCGFIAHTVLKSWNHSFSHCKTNNSWWACPRFGTENMALVASAAPLKRLHCRCYAKNAESSSSSSSSEYNVTVTHKLWITLCYGWRVGIVQPKCVTASAVTAAAVND